MILPAPCGGGGSTIDVLFEDDHLLAISKPAGIVSHPCYKHPGGTVFDELVQYLRGRGTGAAGGASGGVHPRLLHRLDKGTSGVMLVSKTLQAHAAVIRAMTRGTSGGVQKEYLAIVHGAPDPASGEIVLRLRRDPADTRRMASSATTGKESVTRYAALDGPGRFERSASDRPAAGRPSPAASRPASLVLCRPLTGRMHQIRVHLAARGWPIVGDPVYGPRSIDDAVGDRDPAACPDPRPAEGPAAAPTGCRGTGIRIGRQALHAWRVSLAHPVTGRPLVITAPLPSDMVALLDCLGIGQHQPRE